jgi:hypothetical protein
MRLNKNTPHVLLQSAECQKKRNLPRVRSNRWSLFQFLLERLESEEEDEARWQGLRLSFRRSSAHFHLVSRVLAVNVSHIKKHGTFCNPEEEPCAVLQWPDSKQNCSLHGRTFSTAGTPWSLHGRTFSTAGTPWSPQKACPGLVGALLDDRESRFLGGTLLDLQSGFLRSSHSGFWKTSKYIGEKMPVAPPCNLQPTMSYGANTELRGRNPIFTHCCLYFKISPRFPTFEFFHS